MRTIVLNTANKSIVVSLGDAVDTNQPHFVTAYADSSTDAFTEGAVDGVLNDTTEVTIVGAPSVGFQRIVKDISIYNADIATVNLIIAYANSASRRVLASIDLDPGETWTLNGTYTVDGSLKVASPLFT